MRPAVAIYHAIKDQMRRCPSVLHSNSAADELSRHSARSFINRQLGRRRSAQHFLIKKTSAFGCYRAVR